MTVRTPDLDPLTLDPLDLDPLTAELVDLEVRGWDALCEGPDAARAFYADRLAGDAAMLFPNLERLEGRAAILAATGGPPWDGYELVEPRAVRLSGAAALLYYVTARRGGGAPYRASVASVYARADGAWRLALHQHSPL